MIIPCPIFSAQVICIQLFIYYTTIFPHKTDIIKKSPRKRPEKDNWYSDAITLKSKEKADSIIFPSNSAEKRDKMTHKTSKVFNVIGACQPDIHYMVNLAPKLKEIKIMIDNGYYFNRNPYFLNINPTTILFLEWSQRLAYSDVICHLPTVSSFPCAL